MGHVLHDWDLDQKRTLIGKGYAALPSGGALVVYETIIDDDRRQNAFGLLMSLNMLIETPGVPTTQRPNTPSGCARPASRLRGQSTWRAPRAWWLPSNSWRI